jgi:P-type E1-E2 ATPase
VSAWGGTAQASRRVDRLDLLRIVLICVAAGLLRFRLWDALGHPSLFGVTATLVAAYPIFKDAFENVIERRMTMAVPVVIALVAALVIREVFTALVITACLVGARVLETLAVSPGWRGMHRAHADGRRAPIERTAERVASWLPYAALATALVTFIVTRDLRSVMAVMVVAGAGGLSAATPLAIVGAISCAARSGAMVEDGVHLEALWSIDTVVLDQPGTVTLGDVRVTTLYPVTGVSSRELLETAATAECRSEDPIARAIVRYSAEKRIPQREPRRFMVTPGEGVRALDGAEEILAGNSSFVTAGRLSEPPRDDTGSTLVFVVRGGRYLGSVAVGDVPHPETKRAIADLRALGVRTYLFTSESGAATERMARDLAVDDFETGLLPDARRLRVQLLAKTHRVATIGDGPDDWLARTGAAVDVAMGAHDLPKFVDTLRLARRTHAIILQNVFGTVIVDCVGIGLAAIGFVTPVMAAAIHVTSALAFILNSARLVPPR